MPPHRPETLGTDPLVPVTLIEVPLDRLALDIVGGGRRKRIVQHTHTYRRTRTHIYTDTHTHPRTHALTHAHTHTHTTKHTHPCIWPCCGSMITGNKMNPDTTVRQKHTHTHTPTETHTHTPTGRHKHTNTHTKPQTERQ